MVGAPSPNPVKVFMRRRLGLNNALAYGLPDLAHDALALLDYLNVETADVLGISMGGMVAQWLAILAPSRVRALTLLMTSSGYPLLPTPSWKVLKLFLQRAPSRQGGAAPINERDFAAQYLVNLFTLVGSPAFPTDIERRKLWAKAQVQRSIAGLGAARQLAAICDDGARYRQLDRISAPTRIFHGSADLLVPTAHGRDLAKRIPGAQFTEIAGLGHDLPEQLAAYFAAKL
jgi:pimeloyl-ACP methyl ester carboxylesterase